VWCVFRVFIALPNGLVGFLCNVRLGELVALPNGLGGFFV
jgi:hypothetical protein